MIETQQLTDEEVFRQLAAGRIGMERYETFAHWRENRPIFYSDVVDAWVLTRYDDVRHVLGHNELFTPLKTGTGSPVYGRSFLHWSGREHAKKTGVVSRRIRSAGAFADGLEEFVKRLAEERADILARGPSRVDLKAAYTSWIPILVITHLLDMEHATEFREIYDAIEHGGMASVADPQAREHALEAVEHLKTLLAPTIQARRANPGDDMLSDMVSAEYDGAPIPDAEIVSMVAFILTAGVETTDRVLVSLLRHCALDGALWSQVRDRRDDPQFLIALAAEALRFYPPASGITRRVEEPVEIAGIELPAGSRTLSLIASANRDPSRFAEPERFDAERFARKPEIQFTAAGTILPFGGGVHHCTGSKLAMNEMRYSLSSLAQRVQTLRCDGEPPSFEGFLHFAPERLPALLEFAPTS